ncbi:5-formyltetrahydrofolate cyclo-ligase [Sneathiella sp.]|uniref:5-formyltetrahydrofolate cyclo-ligase n=1 Tax=Sneathiella sp. TaxID=1964365 RepID=UPI003562A9D7
MTPSLAEQKQMQRELAFATRRAVDADDAGDRAADLFLANFASLEKTIVSLYWPLGSELDTRPLLHQLHERGAICALPVVDRKDHPLRFRAWEPDTVLEPGSFKTLVPSKSAKFLTPAVVVIPFLAFDADGYRLGYGGGFYDRTLDKLRWEQGCLAVGFGYAAQQVAKVVTDPFDQKLDWVVTEEYVRKIT